MEAAIELDTSIETILRAAEEKKAEDVIALDLREIEGVITDTFIICSGTSERQVGAIAENIVKELKKAGIPLLHSEGEASNVWVLLDCGDVVIHVFLDKVREFYNLEKLWHKAAQIYPAR